jgi:hypothetical protein
MKPPELNENQTDFLGIKLAHTWESYATHQPLLIWALNHSKGDIVELGIGHYSTPIISAVSHRDGRNALSLEDNKEWLKNYSNKETAIHRFSEVKYWPDTISEIAQKQWGMVFVDQEDHAMRLEAVRQLKPKCEWLVMHDSDMLASAKSSDYDWWEFFPAKQPWPERGGPPSILIRGGMEGI